MSLTVHARRRSAQPDDDGGPFESPAPPHNELAGFESWRTTVYGSLLARRLGLRILPALADDDVYASSGQLDELEREVNVLRQSVQALVDELLAQGVHIVTGANPYETVRFRLENIAEAVRLARALPDGDGEVVIW